MSPHFVQSVAVAVVECVVAVVVEEEAGCVAVVAAVVDEAAAAAAVVVGWVEVATLAPQKS
jgi:hypothetical protein